MAFFEGNKMNGGYADGPNTNMAYNPDDLAKRNVIRIWLQGRFNN